MKTIITKESYETIKNYSIPEQYGFGDVAAPVMATCDFENGKWGNLYILPYGPISLSPAAKVFHYGQEVFEGMKAYKTEDGGPYLFRPELNIERFNKSAERMCMPEVPSSIFNEALSQVVRLSEPFIPTGKDESLYLRPFLIATEDALEAKASNKYKFLITGYPSKPYFSNDALTVMIERSHIRAAEGGIGCAKTGGNYAGSMVALQKAQSLGYAQNLWLDARERKYIEELSGMNFFAIIKNQMVTPKITSTILEGITRRSIIALAKAIGIEVVERALSIDEVVSAIEDGSCSELFACGTAAIIKPIQALAEEDGRTYALTNKDSTIALKLKETLLGIQRGRREDPFGWRTEV